MRCLGVIALTAAVLPLATTAQGTFRVQFDQANYTVLPDGIVQVGVLMDPVPSSGLFSFGLKVAYDQVMARVESAAAIAVPPPLDYNGVAGPGAIRLVEAGTVGVKGTVNFFIAPLEAYDGATLATISLRNLGIEGATYSLQMELFRTLGPNETVFVSGAGDGLDSQIQFGSATINVIPEPSAMVLILLSGCLAWVGTARARHPNRSA